MTAFLDTNVIVRHLTDDPPEIAARARAFLASGEQLLLTDVIVAETIYVLESFYEVRREEVALLMRSVVAFPAIDTGDPALLLRALEVYETERIDFAEAYLVASAEISGSKIASFDRSIERVASVARVEP